MLHNIHTIVNTLSSVGRLCYAIFTLLSMLCRVHGSFVMQYSHYCQCFVAYRAALLRNIHTIVNALSGAGQLCYTIFTLLSMLCRVQDSFVTQYSHYCQCFVVCMTALSYITHTIVNALSRACEVCYTIFTLLSMLCRVHDSFVTQYSHYCQCFVACMAVLLHNIHTIVNAFSRE